MYHWWHIRVSRSFREWTFTVFYLCSLLPHRVRRIILPDRNNKKLLPDLGFNCWLSIYHYRYWLHCAAEFGKKRLWKTMLEDSVYWWLLQTEKFGFLTYLKCALANESWFKNNHSNSKVTLRGIFPISHTMAILHFNLILLTCKSCLRKCVCIEIIFELEKETVPTLPCKGAYGSRLYTESTLYHRHYKIQEEVKMIKHWIESIFFSFEE